MLRPCRRNPEAIRLERIKAFMFEELSDWPVCADTEFPSKPALKTQSSTPILLGEEMIRACCKV